MSALPPKADILRVVTECLLLTLSGHSVNHGSQQADIRTYTAYPYAALNKFPHCNHLHLIASFSRVGVLALVLIESPLLRFKPVQSELEDSQESLPMISGIQVELME